MKRWFTRACGWLVSAGVCAVLAGTLAPAGAAQVKQDTQNKTITQTAGVDNTKMGAYRALAQLSLQAFQKGDNATAAELARVLERTWDRGESAERAADKPNHDLYNQIDDAMDGFIGPIMNYATKPPDASRVQAAYNDYLEKLKAAD